LEAEAIPDENTMTSTRKSMKARIAVETARGPIMAEERGQRCARRDPRPDNEQPQEGEGTRSYA